MAVDQGFPAHLFRVGGSPAGIRAAAAGYREFGSTAADAGARMGGFDMASFVGPEADQFLGKLNSDLPPHLDVTARAFTQVARALGTFAQQLSELQAAMRPLAERAPAVWQRVRAAEGAAAEVRAADHVPVGLPAAWPAPAAAELGAARQEWEALARKASEVRAEMLTAADRCSKAIDDARAKRFKQPPGALAELGQEARAFVQEHEHDLKSVSEGLKTASAAVTLLGVALQAIPFVGNAVGGALLVAGGIAAGIAVGIDLAVHAATGEGSLTGIAVDAALTVVPVGRLGQLGKRAFSTAKDWSVLARSTEDTAERAIHADTAKAGLGRWFLRDQHPWMVGDRAINAPRFDRQVLGYHLNCANNVVTVDRRLNGVEVSTAPLHKAHFPDPAALGDPRAAFHEVPNYDHIIRNMRSRGQGARGVVYIARPAVPELNIKESAHVFNVVHGPHGVEFLDGQTGRLAKLEKNVTHIGYMPYR
jgi:hypothetical protein